MAKTAIVTASGVVSATSGEVYSIAVTKAGSGTSPTVQIWDNPTTNSGRKIFEGDGLAVMNYTLHDGAGGGAAATQGIYVVTSAGTTVPEVVVVYD